MALWILRAFFLVVAAGVGVTLAINGDVQPGDLADGADAADGVNRTRAWIIPAFMVGAIAVMAIDILIPRKRIDIISSAYFGILIGLVLASLATFALTPLLTRIISGSADLSPSTDPASVESIKNTISILQLILTVVLWYICTSVLMQTKDDFRFVIPYVEFSKEVKGKKPYVLDTSVIIDGRIADVIETGVLDNQLIMPRFILAELQGIADSNDKMRRARGRRGLDILNRLRSNDSVDLVIYERETPEMTGQPVDMKLVLLASNLDGKVVTGDYNLNKVARLHNVAVVNLNDIANSLKPVFLPGENISIKIVKPGEEQNQGVGYLDDGTMVVVEGGRGQVGNQVNVSVTSVLQTSAGRMIFGKYDSET